MEDAGCSLPENMERKRKKILTDAKIMEELCQPSESEADEEAMLEIIEDSPDDEEDHVEFPKLEDDSDCGPDCQLSSEDDDDLSGDDLSPDEADKATIQVFVPRPSTSRPSQFTHLGIPPAKSVKSKKPKGKPKKTSKSTVPTTQEEDNTPLNRIVKFASSEMIGKNGFEWKTAPLKQRPTKTPSKNIIFTRPGTRGDAANSTTLKECFSAFFSTEIFEIIKTHTNTEMDNHRNGYKTPGHSALKPLCSEELNAFIGVLIRAAGLRDNHLRIDTMFNTKLCGEKYRAVFSRSRFNFLINCLRFDDRETRDERRSISKLAPISEIWNILIGKCNKNYHPGPYLTIDEQLVGFRGKCPFRVYMPAKPNRYGIKTFMMCDNSTKYMVNAIIYEGKGSTPPGVPQAEYITLQLADPVKGSNRNITCDNWFSSVQLATKLLNDYKLTLIGTIRKNKREFPPEFTNPKFSGRNEGSSLFLFNETMVSVSYKPENKSNKIVLLVSTAHDDDSIDPDSGKPEIVLNYNATKGAVDTFEQMCSNICTNRQTRRWPLCIFYNMLNIAVHNSYVVYLNNFYKQKNVGNPLRRFDFVMALADEMTNTWMNVRLTMQIPRELRNSINKQLNLIEPTEDQLQLAALRHIDGGRHYCYYCSYKKKRMTKSYCIVCKKYVCGEHHTTLCVDCHNKLI